MKKSVKILGIETSCDETSAAVVENGEKILSNVISSQIDLHKKYGGVVPEIASRAHIENIIPVIEESLSSANTDWKNIDAIAVTKGPGLLGSLLVGVNTARTLANLKKKPLIALNHLEGHVYANFICENQNHPDASFNLELGKSGPRSKHRGNNKNQKDIVRAESRTPSFPLLAIIVSGGHTNIVYMKDHLSYKILGQTIDDAAGEAFDKVAKLLDLGYPGGPIISKLAIEGDPKSYDLPLTDLTPPPKRDSRGYLRKATPSLDFSFSGLKTAVLNEIKHNPQIANKKPASRQGGQLKANIAASFQQAVIDIVVRNSAEAINMYKPKSFLLSGGVAANSELVKQLNNKLRTTNYEPDFFVPEKILCTDNAAMIGLAAYYRYQKKDFADWKTLSPDPNLKLT